MSGEHREVEGLLGGICRSCSVSRQALKGVQQLLGKPSLKVMVDSSINSSSGSLEGNSFPGLSCWGCSAGVVCHLGASSFWHLRSALEGCYKGRFVCVLSFHISKRGLRDSNAGITGHSADMSSPRPWCFRGEWTRLLVVSTVHYLV